MKYLTMEAIVNEGILSEDISRGLYWFCPHCGVAIKYRENLRAVIDPNPFCPETLSKRAYDMAKSQAWAQRVARKCMYNLIKRLKLRHHFQLFIPSTYEKFTPATADELALQELANKPKSLYFWQIIKFLYIKDFSGTAENYFKKYSCFADIYKYGKPDGLPPEIWESIVSALPYIEEFCESVDIKTVNLPTNAIFMHVWLSGDFPGFARREDYIAKLNSVYGKYIYTVNNDKKVRDTVCLITPDGAPKRGKYKEAQQRGFEIFNEHTYNDMLYKAIAENGIKVEKLIL